MDRLPQPDDPKQPIDPKTPVDPPTTPQKPVEDPNNNDRGIVEIDPDDQKQRDDGAHVDNPWGPGGEPGQNSNEGTPIEVPQEGPADPKPF